jgi:glycosyltransferase involved in cell wall biosynthesis
MKIAIFTELYSPSIGGQEAFFKGLGEALQRRGHTIDVYCIGHEAGLSPNETIDGISVNRFPIAANYKAPAFSAMRRDWRQIARFALRTRQIAKSGQHDFYLLNQWPLLHVLTLPRRARASTLLHWCEVRNSWFYKLAQTLLPKRVAMNGAISDSVGAEIGALSGRPFITLPSGLDLSRAVYKPRDERRDIVVLGRVAEHKNLGMLVDAFEVMRGRGYAGRLKIAGGGPDMDTLKARVAASPVGDQIDLLGFITDAQKFELLANCEIFAMPSKREGFPHVISEAMCCGLPVVTADYPENGSRDVVANFSIGAVTAQSAEAFARGMEEVLEKWETYSSNGLAVAQTLDWNSIAERLEVKISQSVE